ncbi:MAG TPA: RNA polymerase-binding protein DksA [Candidatus Binataceae bacterium]|nr:RNA polymerase-binding protein DksA [Candidatus Binataceae bacterium]
MRQRDLKLFRKLLQERKRDILDEAGRAVGAMNNGAEEPYADPTDRAALESDRNFLLRMRDRDRKLLTKIEEAVARIEDGTYGRCEACDGEIGIERLRARPVTTFCISCKSAQEERERQG